MKAQGRQGPHENETRMKLRNFKWRHSETHRQTGEEILFGGAEVGDALPTFSYILMKGIIVTFGNTEEVLKV